MPTQLFRVEWCHPNIHVYLGPQNVMFEIFVRNNVFAVIIVKLRIMWALKPITGILIRGEDT